MWIARLVFSLVFSWAARQVLLGFTRREEAGLTRYPFVEATLKWAAVVPMVGAVVWLALRAAASAATSLWERLKAWLLAGSTGAPYDYTRSFWYSR